MRRPTLLVALLLALAATGCASLRGDQHLLEFLTDGVTQRSEVEQRLGPPTRRYAKGTLVTYQVDKGRRGYRVNAAAAATIHGLVSSDYSLVIAYDETGTVRRSALIPVAASHD